MAKQSSKAKYILILCILSFPIGTAFAKHYYLYNDKDGIPILDSTIPPEAVKQGYKIININGHVLKEVSRSLSKAEKKKAR